jgi:cytochrome P450
MGEPQPVDVARSFDLFDLPEGYYESPYPWFRLLRDHDPVHRNSDGSVLLTRHNDVRTVWRDTSNIVDKRDQFARRFGDGALFEHHTTGMLFRDPPDHDRLRAIVNPFFSQTSIMRLRTFVEQLVDELLAEAAERRELDFVHDVAFRIPIAVICRILGLPREDGDRVHELGTRILYPLNPNVPQTAIEAGDRATEAFLAYLRGHVDRARWAPSTDGEPGDIIGALVAAERAGEEISEAEILHMCILMLNGGHETTTNLLAVSVHSLLDEPAQLEELRRHGDEIAATAVEECIRYVSPLQLQGRRTTRPVTLPSGAELPAATEVILCQASANRDERAFEDPDRLDLGRKPNAHVAFGAGIHVCIGRPLARLEAAIALPRLAQKFARIERTAEPEFNRNARFRGLATLPVCMHPR